MRGPAGRDNFHAGVGGGEAAKGRGESEEDGKEEEEEEATTEEEEAEGVGGRIGEKGLGGGTG